MPQPRTIGCAKAARRQQDRRHGRVDLYAAAGMDEHLPRVELALWRADALVLFDWLQDVVTWTRCRSATGAEASVDGCLLMRLEETDVVQANEDEIEVARADVSRDMAPARSGRSEASEARFVELRACHQPVGKSDPVSGPGRR